MGVGAVEPVVEPRSERLKPSVEWTDAAELKKLEAALVSGCALNMDWGTTGWTTGATSSGSTGATGG